MHTIKSNSTSRTLIALFLALLVVASSCSGPSSVEALIESARAQDPTREAPAACTDAQAEQEPCRCCKMNCWYAISKGATHSLGHVPGEAGEREALATLRLIRVCMISECATVCAAEPRQPFNSLGLAAILEARKRLQQNEQQQKS